MSLRRRLTILVTLASAPTLALVAHNTLEWREFITRRAGDDAVASARLVAAELTQLREGTRHLMIALTEHPSVPNDEAGCSAHFRAVVKNLAIYREAALIDRTGRFHCSSIEIPPTLDVRDRVYFREPLQTNAFTIGTVTTGRVTGERSLHMSMPYKSRDGSFDGVVVLILNPDRIGRDFARRTWPAIHQLTVLDREGSLVFAIPEAEGQAAPVTAVASYAFQRAKFDRARTFAAKGAQGNDEIVGVMRVDEEPNGLFVAVSVDLDLALAELWESAWRNTIFAIIAVLFALLSATIVGYFLLQRPVLELVHIARRREAGDTKAQFPALSRGSELGLLSKALSDMSAKVDGLLEQKEFLLRELQHRVMNSLQILSSLLLMQSRHAKEPETQEQLQRARDRVMSMGIVYRHLYRTETVGPVEFGEFLRLICEESERAYGGARSGRIVCKTEPLFVSSNTATALAVLIHELITNAFKHAYPEDEEGAITIAMSRGPKREIEFRVTDRGRGLPEDFSPDSASSLGFRVIMSTIRRFGGTLEIHRLSPGTEFAISLPASLEAKADIA
ncbi:MAG: ATP-binding protein [Bradyrhizobiaceae bacterium]|nr:ATP-binding protein [Bradyrhizobiaceae bacterium]